MFWKIFTAYSFLIDVENGKSSKTRCQISSTLWILDCATIFGKYLMFITIKSCFFFQKGKIMTLKTKLKLFNQQFTYKNLLAFSRCISRIRYDSWKFMCIFLKLFHTCWRFLENFKDSSRLAWDSAVRLCYLWKVLHFHFFPLVEVTALISVLCILTWFAVWFLVNYTQIIWMS